VRIVVIEFISLDGVVQAPGGAEEDTDGGFAHGGWSHRFFDNEVVGGAFDAALRGADAMLFGRRTWEVSAPAWTGQAGDPFADRLNALPKYVVSDSLREEELTWNTTRFGADEIVDRVEGLRSQEGGDVLVMGSPTVVRSLLGAGLVDELRLCIEPVILGGGKSIFPADGRLHLLELVDTTTSPRGVQVCTYRRVEQG
jgi:dihydrofolate reductase